MAYNQVDQGISNLYSVTTKGQNSEEVRKLQQALIAAGYNIPAGATGYYGSQTEAALNQWKQSLGQQQPQTQNQTAPQTTNNVSNTVNWNSYYQSVLNNPTSTPAARAEAERALGQQSETQPQENQNSQETTQTYSTGNQQLDDMLSEMKKALDNIISQGQTVNPDIELTPAQIQQFIDMASQQISPYYRSQIDAIKSDLTKSVENLQKQYDISKKGEEATFKQNLGISRENNAGAGLTFSGNRGQQEQNMLQAQNRTLDLNALQNEASIGNAIRTAEGQIGSSNLPNMPQFQGYQASLEGQGGFTPSRTLNFGSRGGITGTINQSQQEAEAIRLSKLKQAARENRSLDFYL